MYIKIILFSFIVLASSRCECQEVSKLKQDSVIYNFMNLRYNSDNKIKYLAEKSEISELEFIEKIIDKDSNFNSLDRNYMHAQLENSKGFYWDPSKLLNLTVVKADTLRSIFNNDNGWKIFRGIYGKKCLRNFCVPIFTLDGRFCILHWHIQCDYLTGEGGIILLEKINGSYVERKVYLTIVS